MDIYSPREIWSFHLVFEIVYEGGVFVDICRYPTICGCPLSPIPQIFFIGKLLILAITQIHATKKSWNISWGDIFASKFFLFKVRDSKCHGSCEWYQWFLCNCQKAQKWKEYNLDNGSKVKDLSAKSCSWLWARKLSLFMF